MPVFEEVRGGFMATIKLEKFLAIQRGGEGIGEGIRPGAYGL